MMDKLLLIDDEPDIVRVLSMSLKVDGYDVVTATSGVEGLEAYDRETPEIVITDIKMPGMDGIEVLKKIKEINPETEVIIITGHGDIENAIEALKHGASDFINKPVKDAALSIALKRAREKLDIRQQLREYTTGLEEKVAEATAEIRRQANFQSKLINSSADGIVATDRDLRVVVFNPGAERIFGWSSAETVDRMTIADLYPQALTEGFRQALVAENGRMNFAWRETSIQSREGDVIPVRFSGSVLKEKGSPMGTVAFFQDLSEIKRLEKELVQAERLASIGQTVAGLAHGIKNILHGLKGGSYLVDIGVKRNDTERLKKGWDTVKRNIERTSVLVMDLLSYSKEREPEFEPCRPNAIAADVCELLQQRARENDIAIVQELDPAVEEVYMDPHTIHTVLLNLMTNAIDACLFDVDTDKKWEVGLKTMREAGKVIRFEVSDTGSGMSPATLEKLFASFFSTKGHRGTGLGLMVTRKLIEEHEGSINVTSTPGKGTTFTIMLPFREEMDP
jgi:PAS domain S-box-containing protein